MMKEAIKQHAPFFNTDRMVQEYSEKYYFEGAKNEVVLNENDGAKAEEIAKWRKHLQANWNKIQVDRVEAKPDGEITVGGEIPVEADIVLGSIEPDNVAVDLYYGPIDSKGEFHHGNPVPMKVENAATTGEARYRFVGKVPCASTGRNAFAVRVLPRHDLAAHPYEPGLITWG
jgi:starch phosphorylase